jgi:hypothetical protein
MPETRSDPEAGERGEHIHSGKYVPRVVVKFHDVPYDDEALQYDWRRYLEEKNFAALVHQFPNIAIEKLFTSASPVRIRELALLAQHRDPTYHAPNFLTYFSVPCPSPVNPEEVMAAFDSLPTVEFAYIASGPTKPPGVILSPNEGAKQGYLGAAPTGIDAHFAWGVTGGDGAAANLQFVDIERGWTIRPGIAYDHEDLPPGINLIWGSNNDYFGHGAAVLGVICAVPGNTGPANGGLYPRDCVGITPRVPNIMVSSVLPGPNLVSRENAIAAAIDRLLPGRVARPGDVLLLEDQVNAYGYYPPDLRGGQGWAMYVGLPVETEPALFDVIREATALGIIVIEAAGNGGLDLDQFTPSPDDRWGQDSKAIVVAAATSAVPHDYQYASNFGRRMDCYAWGDLVYSAGDWDKGFGPSDYAWAAGGSTSAASAIIAGAALAVQGMAQANRGSQFGPDELRPILKDWQTGTLSKNSTLDPLNWNADRIGVMPNLRRIAEAQNLVPDVYVRDHVGDTGDAHAGMISVSPDIILRPAPPVADPQGTYGQGSGTENDAALSVAAQAGIDHLIYVRVRNRGGAGAENVRATVYWSEIATLVTPNLWHLVGSVVMPQVPRVNVLTVSDPILWSQNQIPHPGHYCFVALVGNVADPEPALADFQNWANFERFIRDNNNVTWRNFNVVDNTPTMQNVFGIDVVRSPFLITGPHDGARDMRLEVVARLPKGAHLMVKVRGEHREMIDELGREWREDMDGELVRIKPRGRTTTDEIRFPENFPPAPAHLDVYIPRELRRYTYEVYIRQLYRRREVGRITWRFAPLGRGR